MMNRIRPLTTPRSIPLPEPLWTREAASHLIDLMRARGVSYDQLAVELSASGTDITGAELEECFLSADLSAGLFFQILHVFGEERVSVAQIDPYDG